MQDEPRNDNTGEQDKKKDAAEAAAPVRHALTRTGTVVSDKMNKTVVVRVDSVTRHPVYKKVVRRSRKIKAHDEKNEAKTGDTVRIVQCRPLSKDKRWRLIEVTEKAKV